ncbi:Hypothetical predicted protein [Pelobates cultripes]|uniref:Uncharacterized protein n=1 Tax=Pelobates cultripes TaxID=61616 RepID=A0AAD1W3U4_PELCU|nr:Hypothetical predicted protein [Pelobates cultripes]
MLSISHSGSTWARVLSTGALCPRDLRQVSLLQSSPEQLPNVPSTLETRMAKDYQQPDLPKMAAISISLQVQAVEKQQKQEDAFFMVQGAPTANIYCLADGGGVGDY